MKAEIKKLWIDALLSGDYVQGEGVLRNEDNEFCCLGVLCDLHAKATDAKWAPADAGDDFDFEYKKCYERLPEEVAEWAGFEAVELIPDVRGVDVNVFDQHGDPSELSYLNDEGMSFSDIAKIIETDL